MFILIFITVFLVIPTYFIILFYFIFSFKYPGHYRQFPFTLNAVFEYFIAYSDRAYAMYTSYTRRITTINITQTKRKRPKLFSSTKHRKRKKNNRTPNSRVLPTTPPTIYPLRPITRQDNRRGKITDSEFFKLAFSVFYPCTIRSRNPPTATTLMRLVIKYN